MTRPPISEDQRRTLRAPAFSSGGSCGAGEPSSSVAGEWPTTGVERMFDSREPGARRQVSELTH